MFLKSKITFFLSSFFISLAMCFPQTLSFLSIFFLIPILFYIDKNKLDFSKKKEVIKAWLMMFVFGFLFAIFSSFWFFDTYPLDWLNGINNIFFSLVIIFSILFIYSFIIAIPISFWILLIYKFKKENILVNAFLGASFWVLLEYFRYWFSVLSVYGNQLFWGPHYTNYSLAYSSYNIFFIKDLIPVGGIYLASFIIILINYFIYYLLFKINKDNKKLIIALGIFMFVVISSSFLYMKSLRATGYKIVEVSVGNTYLLPGINFISQGYREKTSFNLVSEIKNKDGIVIIPENLNIIKPFLNSKDDSKVELIKRNNLIIGSSNFGDYFAMYFFNPQNGDVKYYPKQLLMPVGEYSISWMRFLIKLTNNKEWIDTYDNIEHFAKKGDGIFVYKDEKSGALISGGLCSENISPYIYRDETRSGANMLLNVASHGPFHGSPLLFRQTVAINTVRALENGRYLVTATNKDKSFVITDDGNVQDISTSTKEYSYFNSQVKLKEYITPYVKYGDYVVLLLLGLILTLS